MAFTVPNRADAAARDQAGPDSVDFGIISAGIEGDGVTTGLEVTEDSPASLTVDHAAGTLIIADSLVTIGAGTVTATAADPSLPRFDLVVVNSVGTVSIVAGTPLAANRVFPAIPATSVVLAALDVQAGATTIPTARITDKRAIVKAPVLRDGTTPLTADWDAGAFDIKHEDNKGTIYGSADDSRVYFDGLDLVLDPKLVGSGVVLVRGNIRGHVDNFSIGIKGIGSTIEFTSVVPRMSLVTTSLTVGGNCDMYVGGVDNKLQTWRTSRTEFLKEIFVTNPDDTASNLVIRLIGNNRTSAANDDEAYFQFDLATDATFRREFARMTWVAVDVADLSRDGAIRFDVMVANTLTKILTINGSGIAAVGDVDGTTIGGITTADLLDKLAAETIAGAWVFNGAVVFNETGADVDYRIEGSGEANLFYTDAGNDRVGIGTAFPSVQLTIFNAGGLAQAAVENSGNFLSYFSNNGSGPALFWDKNASKNDLRFGAADSLSGGGFEEFVRITREGQMAIGSPTASIDARLDVHQASATGAQPVAKFDQADVSEEMLEFACTIGVGNAIEAVGAKTLTVTHFIKVTIPGGLARYFEVGTIA